MAKHPKIKPLTIAQQKASIKQKYSRLIENMSNERDELICVLKLQPSKESRSYTVKIRYKIGGSPQVWLLEPPLAKYNGKLPSHIYAEDKNGLRPLCVYCPSEDKWSSQKSIAMVFVPWVITWLYAYEIWQVTGEWTYPERHDG